MIRIAALFAVLLCTLPLLAPVQAQTTFGPQQALTPIFDAATFVSAADLDGDLDVLSASSDEDKIAWYENTNGQGTFGPHKQVSHETDGAWSVYAADLDGDGDLDVLSASSGDDKIAWYENTDGQGAFGSQKVISIQTAGAQSVYAADLDGDGDQDILSASFDDNKIAWYENTDGQGTFGPQQVISNQAGGARAVYAADIDGDGDLDVLSASELDDKVAWYENTDGKGTFSPQQVISTAADTPQSVYAADLDGDGDFDILSAFDQDIEVAWYENTDGKGTFGSQRALSTHIYGAQSALAADLDGDGDQDVLSANIFGIIALYENTDGKGTFGPEQRISIQANGAQSVLAADLDGDGDLDVLSASSRALDNKIAWYENTDGQGTFGPQQVISTQADGAQSVYAADLDGDGDLDVLSASNNDDKIAWYENLTLHPTAVEHAPGLPDSFVLEPPFPNPFNPLARVRFAVTEAAPVQLALYDALGRRVAVLYRGVPEPGRVQEVTVEGATLPGGVYFVRLTGRGISATRALTLLK